MVSYILLKLAALQVEWHWHFITRYRRRLSHLAGAGIPLTSGKLIAVTHKIARHCYKSMYYENICKTIAGGMGMTLVTSKHNAQKAA